MRRVAYRGSSPSSRSRLVPSCTRTGERQPHGSKSIHETPHGSKNPVVVNFVVQDPPSSYYVGIVHSYSVGRGGTPRRWLQ
mmetsp:Transcript_19957/g.33193  ORF Transcript_19957/g.33193 Transcript_19957/m.33193 type:complete len:81 (+) Transcript_19957:88-330(+)